MIVILIVAGIAIFAAKTMFYRGPSAPSQVVEEVPATVKAQLEREAEQMRQQEAEMRQMRETFAQQQETQVSSTGTTQTQQGVTVTVNVTGPGGPNCNTYECQVGMIPSEYRPQAQKGFADAVIASHAAATDLYMNGIKDGAGNTITNARMAELLGGLSSVQSDDPRYAQLAALGYFSIGGEQQRETFDGKADAAASSVSGSGGGHGSDVYVAPFTPAP